MKEALAPLGVLARDARPGQVPQLMDFHAACDPATVLRLCELAGVE